MLIDSVLLLADAQAVTASAVGNKVIDLGAADLDLPQGTHLDLWILLTTPFTSTANTLAIEVRNDGSDPATTVIQTIMPATATSALGTAGVIWRQTLPILNGRYLNLYFTVSTTLVAGVITAFATLS